LRGHIIGGWRELDNLTPHDSCIGYSPFQQIYEEICITHTLVYLWGLFLAGGMTENDITSLCSISTFTYIFPTISAVHFLAFAFLAITFWSKEWVITGIEGLMSSGSVTNVTGTLYRMAEEHILLDSPHKHASC
jgi:hypothetical protein